jgi:O-antigen/teichoic acid export membrane protein
VHLAGNIAPVLAGLITAPLTARSLGPAARGELAILLLVSVFIGLVGALGLGLVARQAVSADLRQAHGWSERGRRITLISVIVAILVGFVLSSLMGLEPTEAMAATALFALAGMSASKSIDANVLIVAGLTRQFGIANMSASGTVCLGIVGAYLTGTLTLASALLCNAASLVAQMILITLPRRRLLRSVPQPLSKPEPFRSLMKRAWKAWRSQVLEAGLTRSDSLLFMTQSALQIVGYYAVVSLIPVMAYQVFQTLIQRSYGRNPTLRLKERTWRLWQQCVILSVPLTTVAAAAAVMLIPALFGEEFVPAIKLVVPACVMTLGLAGLAPVLQHYAVSPMRDVWFPISLVSIYGAGWLSGLALDPSSGVILIGILFAALSGVYIYLLAGPKAFRRIPQT